MKKLIISIAALAALTLCGGSFAAGDPISTPQALDNAETATLIYMREEEKLARDTYITLYDLWSMRLFDNIQSSEQRHMDAMLRILNLFSIADAVTSVAVGMFTDPELATLYSDLTARGAVSQMEALMVGGFIEEMDIRDLRLAITETDEPALINSYSNLLAGSRNHLRTFVSHVIALGGSYEAQVLDPLDVEEIVGDFEAVPGENFRINVGLNDAWYYPPTAGQGFFITVYPDIGKVFRLVHL
ncbi:MAG: DUF2202 domain-containing protein [Xanthomonadales bacterium]|nr:DUF2202 domain-containing protein [Xanthomonadales bacterium]